ncbi:dapper homolog 1 [Electrophorus electricus]|uniref:Dapper homolog 1 n=1 Tax=Electrophorus electricus TaxID=8005 RepID=A0A4W4EB91_ELEEL|nr:dapper homolog 1 [Electrophorus electricus]XP_026869020.2 dapper homolog 1 [Electrophorus electricus]
MKQTVALAEMLVSKDCTRERRELEVRARERMEGEVDRGRTRERLEATLAGLGELEYLRQRQELLVRTVLNFQESVSRTVGEDKVYVSLEDSYLNNEEKLLEENILLLRKQLNCLRRRDAGLISQLQELDRQISDLRLDTEASHEHVETDSRPSSGFYDLSDGASGSLSNSSNSVFSECLSSCRSSTCLCTPLDTSLCVSEGRPKSADELGVCAECEGHCEDSNSGTVRRSLSAPYSPSPDGSYDSLSKYHCDLLAKNGNDVYRYPSPLHAVAVQSPIFFQSIASHLKEEGGFSKSGEAPSESQKLEQPLVPQSTSWHTSQASTNKRLDSYIFGLLQRRVQPVRTNKPRTSINTDPSKSVLRQGSICVRPSASVHAQPWGNELKPNWQTSLQPAAAPSTETSTMSPQRQWSVENKGELLENRGSSPQSQNGYLINTDINTNSLLKKKGSGASKGQVLTVVAKEVKDLGSPNAVSSPKLNKHSYYPAMEDNKSAQVVKSGTPKRCSKIQAPLACSAQEECPISEVLSLGSSSQSQDEGGQVVSAQFLPAQDQCVKLRKCGSKSIKIVKVKNAKSAKPKTHTTEPASEADRDRKSKKSRMTEDMTHSHKASKRTSCKLRRIPVSIPEGRILEKHSHMGRASSQKHHSHHRHHDAVVAKPKYKRNDYHRRLRGVTEVPYEQAFRRAYRRQKREMLGQISAMYLPSSSHLASPYSYVGSDSEYSAECASLFHSTILDTSEDERSNYTTNCFGDSESSASEGDFVAESSTSSDSEDSAGVNWPQFGQPSARSTLNREMTSAQARAFVKIKASHNLKKKILRFRSGSLKLMTTV